MDEWIVVCKGGRYQLHRLGTVCIEMSQSAFYEFVQGLVVVALADYDEGLEWGLLVSDSEVRVCLEEAKLVVKAARQARSPG